MGKEFNEDRKTGFFRTLWNKFIAAITGKTPNKQLESGVEVNNGVEQRGDLKGIEQFQNGEIEIREGSHENDFKKELAAKTSFQGFEKPNHFDLEKSKETPDISSNGEVSEQRLKGDLTTKEQNKPEKRVKGDLFDNSLQEESTENSTQEESFKGFKKAEEIKDTDEPEL